MKEELLDTKCKLYSLLLKLNDDIITDNEIEMMFLLSKDEQIQKFISENI